MSGLGNLLEWGREYGWWVVILMLAALNAGKIWLGIERGLAKVWPAFATTMQKRREERLEKEQLRTEVERERDTILALKEMLERYRKELDASTEERRSLQGQLIEVIGKYERHDAQVIEVLRDISEALREQGRRLDVIEQHIGG